MSLFETQIYTDFRRLKNCENLRESAFLLSPYTFSYPDLMRKPLTSSQCVVLALAWAALCFIVLTSSPQIDGILILTILISGALVFIPIVKALKKKQQK